MNKLISDREKKFMKGFILYAAFFYLYFSIFYYTFSSKEILHKILLSYYITVVLFWRLSYFFNIRFKLLVSAYIISYAFLQCLFHIGSKYFLSLFIFYIPLFLTINYLYQNKYSKIFWNIYLCSMLLASFYFSKLFNFEVFEISKVQMFIHDASKIILNIFFTFYIYKHSETLKNKMIIDTKNKEINFSNDTFTQSPKIDKLAILYNDIIQYLEEEKPWQNPNFNSDELSEKLNTNRTYISNALKYKGKTNFNTLINKYRVQQVLNDFHNLQHEKYTISSIYKQAGFSYQASFNRVFKQVTGFTASEYLKEKGLK